MRACISTIDADDESVIEKARNSPSMENRELASVVTTEKPYEVPAAGAERFHVVCYDFGVKTNSLRELRKPVVASPSCRRRLLQVRCLR